jgi:hypothetical protein
MPNRVPGSSPEPVYNSQIIMKLKRILLVAGMAAVQQFASAALFYESTTGLSSPAQTITFSELSPAPANGTALTTQLASLGVTFDNNSVYYNPQPNSLYPNFSYPYAGNYVMGYDGIITGPVVPFSIHFTTPVSSAALVLATADGVTTTLEALLGGSVVYSGSVPTHYTTANDWYGFTGITFDQIRINSGSGVAVAFDNVEFSVVPEASTWLAGCFALAVCCHCEWRRRRVQKSTALHYEADAHAQHE